MADISNRLLDQRLRTAMAERLLMLVDWQETLKMGADEYFNSFYDVFPDQGPLEPNSTVTEGEQLALQRVLDLVGQAADSTPDDVNAKQLIATGWPERISSLADEAYQVMAARGRYSDAKEENAPSEPFSR